MGRGWRVGLVALVGALAALTATLLGADPVIADLAVLAAGVAIGEMVVLHPQRRSPLPLSFAVFTVLVRAATPVQFVVVVVLAEVVAAFLRMGRLGFSGRSFLLAERCAEAFVAGIAFNLVMRIGNDDESLGVVVLALTLAALAPIVVSDLVVYMRERVIAPLSARAVDVAVVTSGILMAVGFDGIDGDGRLGLWGPILFSIPLIAAWYSFELLASTRKTFEQTVQALAAAPELGGRVRVGHADRVADLADAMGRVLDLSPNDLEQLRTAALLHHLGTVCLDEPDDGFVLDPVEVATAGANMLRGSEVLAGAGDVVAAEPLLHRPPGAPDPPAAALSGMILKVASAYDELTEGDDAHAVWAVEALYTGPGYVYDGRVLGALERALERRGALSRR
ncbi:MAG: hypothetical protein KDB35_23865 [Acidimicrobiales bacterium]|nr:hypothetical protein [Acidimicrobiales bacterium]